MGLNIFNLPGVAEVAQSARAAMKAAMPGSDPWAWPNNANPVAKFVGGLVWTAYQRLDFVGRQSFVLFAEGKYLDNHGAELGLPRKQATAASGHIVLTVTDAVSVMTGAVFVRADGVTFFSTGPTSTSGAGSVSVPVVGPAGAAANTEAGAPMTPAAGLSGAGAAGATAAVDGSGLAGGADIEPDGLPRSRDLRTYRGRILFRKANPAQGGSPADFVTWALGVAGVTRVFVERRWNGPGTVRVFPIFDDLFGYANGIPDSGHIATVDAALQPLAPAGCALTVAAPVAQTISVDISNLRPDTTAVRSAIVAELVDTFRRLGAVSGSDAPFPGMPYLASPQTFPAIYIEQAVANAAGVISADVAASDVPILAGRLPVLGAINFV